MMSYTYNQNVKPRVYAGSQTNAEAISWKNLSAFDQCFLEICMNLICVLNSNTVEINFGFY